MAVMGSDGDSSIIVRSELLRRVAEARPNVVLLQAPAGYGKTEFARQLAAGYETVSVCDCHGIDQPGTLAHRLLAALAGELPAAEIPAVEHGLAIAHAGSSEGDLLAIVLGVWEQTGPPSVFIFENAEALGASASLRALVVRLLKSRPAQRTIVMCTRTPLWLRSNRFLPPHALLRLDGNDLAFDRDEIATMIAHDSAHGAAIDRIAVLSRGWPIVVRLMARLSRERDLVEMCERLNAREWSDLHDYLAAEIIDGLTPKQFDALLLCSVLPEASVDDLVRTLALEDGAVRAMLGELPFVGVAASGAINVHLLLQSLLQQHHAQRMRELLRAAALAWDETESLRDAELLATLGDYESAVSRLAARPWQVRYTPSGIRTTALLPPDMLFRDPGIFIAHFNRQRYVADPAEAFAAAEAMWRSLDATDPNSIPYAVPAIGFAVESGNMEFAQQFLAALPIDIDAIDLESVSVVFVYAEAHLRAHVGALSAAAPILERMLRAHADKAPYLGQLLTLRGAFVERGRGERDRERASLDQAVEALRTARSPNLMAGAVALAAIGSWIAGEDASLERALFELEALAAEGMPSLEPFLAAMRGRADAALLEHIGYPDWQAYGAMAMAARADTPVEAGRYARMAISAAERSGQPFVEALAHIAFTCCVPSERDSGLKKAHARAESIDSPFLAGAIARLRAGDADTGMLGALVRRFQQRGPRGRERVNVHVFRAEVTVADRPVAIPDQQLALLCAIAAQRRGATRDELVDMFWPRLAPARANDALKSCLYRLRRRVPNVVVHDAYDDRYRVGDTIDVDLTDLEVRFGMLLKSAADPIFRAELQGLLDAIRYGDRARLRRWDWFESVDRRIGSLRREIARALAGRALDDGRFDEALTFSQLLIDDDPVDEEASETAIRAHLGRNDAASALREYRRYRDLLYGELEIQPSERLRRLVVEQGAP